MSKNKPVAPARRPVAFKPTAKVTAPADFDEDDLDTGDEDEDDDTEVETSATTKKARLPGHKRMANRIGRIADRLVPYADKVGGWGSTRDLDMGKVQQAVLDGIAALRQASDALDALPASYTGHIAKAKGSTKANGRALAAGTLVRVTDKQIEDYTTVLTATQMRGMTVVELRGNKVFVRTTDGCVGMFPRGHVCVDLEAATTDATAS